VKRSGFLLVSFGSRQDVRPVGRRGATGDRKRFVLVGDEVETGMPDLGFSRTFEDRIAAADFGVGGRYDELVCRLRKNILLGL